VIALPKRSIPLIAMVVFVGLAACAGSSSITVPGTVHGAGDRAPEGRIGATPTPTPSPIPSATPTPGPYLTVVLHAPTLTAKYGANTYACPVEVTTSDPNDTFAYANLIEYASSPSRAFPVYGQPTLSALSWTVPDLATASEALYNAGMPGQTIWTSRIAHQTQRHCVNFALTVAPTVPAGNYPVDVTYLTTIGEAAIGLHAIAESETISFAVQVSGQ
jgi:hypothetical protein